MMAAASATIAPVLAGAPDENSLTKCRVVVFSKVYQELKLNYTQAAALTAEAGLDGIDCPARPGGEVLPERAAEDLPAYARALRENGIAIHLLTTAIVNPSTPHAETVLRAASKLGIRYYRLGFFKPRQGQPFERQAAEIRSGLKDLSQLNRELGLCALFQNHGGSVGAHLDEAALILEGLDPDILGAAFDLGHALAVHGLDWRPYFEKIKSRLRIAYIKDAKIGDSWVPFGEGDFGKTDYFTVLKQVNYTNPFSLHIEFDWSGKGKAKTRQALLNTLRESRAALKGWLDAA